MFSIGELSRQTGVKVPTIRYYEQMALIAAPQRTGGNQRRYSASELNRLGFIKHARDLGFSIDSIRDLLALGAGPEQPCAQADRIAQVQLGNVREKIQRLLRLEKELDRIVQGCAANGTTSDCYVLAALSDHNLCEAEH